MDETGGLLLWWVHDELAGDGDAVWRAATADDAPALATVVFAEEEGEGLVADGAFGDFGVGLPAWEDDLAGLASRGA